jgi:hypothetical protein
MTDPTPPTNGRDHLDWMTVLKLYVDLANSERQAIWTRQMTMLLGNSVIFSAIKLGKLDKLANIAGLFLCLLWFVMTWYGWTYFYEPMNAAKQLPIASRLNPFATTPTKRHTDEIFLCAMLVVALFAVMYFLGLCGFLTSER